MIYDGKIWVGTGTDGIPAFLLPQMANRHGLIAGATGTGKTVSLKVMAEGFSDMGVPVFLGDIKSDLSGMVKPGEPSAKLADRLAKVGVTEFSYKNYPTVYWDVYGDAGHPVRTTVQDMGSMLLSRMLSLNETQSGVLNILFRVANDEGYPLLDIKDVKAMLVHLGEHASDYTLKYGNVSKASIGAIQRAVALLEDQGGDKFFGEPALRITDWMQQDENGKGYINILACDKLFLSPLMYSTFMLWMLTELYDVLPEQGDLDKPRMVFFFDEAHLLFADCSKQLMEKIEQVVRLIRSKGVGVYFITQSPTDIPMTVLGQLGNRIQHALRAYTPLDQKAVKVAAQTFRANSAFDTEEAITNLSTGEALISFLDAKGAPGVVTRATILPPQSYMGAISESLRREIIETSPFQGIYEQAIDRDSAYEMLQHTKAEQQAPVQTSLPFLNYDRVRSVFTMATQGFDPNYAQQTAPVEQQPVQQPVQQYVPVQQAAQPQGFMVFDPTTGTYVQQQVPTMNAPVQQAAQYVQQGVAQAQQYVQQGTQYVQQGVAQAQQYVQQGTQYVQQGVAQAQQYVQQGVADTQQAVQYVQQQPVQMQAPAQQPQTIQQNMLVQDPTTGMYTQKLVTLVYDQATGQYVRIMSEAEIKEAAKAQEKAAKAAEKAQAAETKAAKEAEAAERRQRNDELREERAERARENNSILGRVKNTAVSTATRTVTSKVINGLTKSIENALKGKK